MAHRASSFNSRVNGDFRCKSLVATDDCFVYYVGAAYNTNGIFIQTGQLQKGDDGFIYRPKGIGEIWPRNRTLSPRTSSIHMADCRAKLWAQHPSTYTNPFWAVLILSLLVAQVSSRFPSIVKWSLAVVLLREMRRRFEITDYSSFCVLILLQTSPRLVVCSPNDEWHWMQCWGHSCLCQFSSIVHSLFHLSVEQYFCSDVAVSRSPLV